jgi:hypothetical protein
MVMGSSFPEINLQHQASCGLEFDRFRMACSAGEIFQKVGQRWVPFSGPKSMMQKVKSNSWPSVRDQVQ